ncbi:uncharacterized protein LOC135174557 [Pogoniulus pusillus]|uniref:uncharacterized protein LOC135174557 n=1 Tax=Pogoniulus pusillus TaxID=488313 RepID=UPI0030B93747
MKGRGDYRQPGRFPPPLGRGDYRPPGRFPPTARPRRLPPARPLPPTARPRRLPPPGRFPPTASQQRFSNRCRQLHTLLRSRQRPSSQRRLSRTSQCSRCRLSRTSQCSRCRWLRTLRYTLRCLKTFPMFLPFQCNHQHPRCQRHQFPKAFLPSLPFRCSCLPPPLPAPPPYSGPFSPLPASATISPRPAQTPFATFRPAPPAAAGPSWTSATEAGPSSQAREPPPVINSDASDSSQSDADDTIDNVADDLQKLRIMPSGNAQPLAAPQATEITGKTLQLTPVGPQHRWRAVIRDALLQGDWEAAAALEGAAAFPVVAARTADGQPGATHTALDWKLLMQLKTAVSSHGLHSQPTKQLLNYIFSAYVLCPADCETVARLILTPSQFMLWERAWRDECRKVVEQPRQLGDPLLNVQADILLGKGAFSSLDAQIRHPFEWHHASMTTARTAFNMVPTEPKAPSYTAVKQGLSEDYNHFIDRLAAAVEAATELDAATRQAFFRTLAFENANNKTKQLLSILPREASVDDMLERVARMPTNQQQTFVATQMDQVLDKHTQLVMAALRSADAGNRGRRYNNPRNPCFRCGLTGHPRDNCPQAAVWCDHCQLDSHATAACKRSGNYQRSAAGSRARTQVAAPVMLSAQQPPAASGWILQQQ